MVYMGTILPSPFTGVYIFHYLDRKWQSMHSFLYSVYWGRGGRHLRCWIILAHQDCCQDKEAGYYRGDEDDPNSCIRGRPGTPSVSCAD